MSNYSIDLEKYTVCAYNEPVSSLVLGPTVTGEQKCFIYSLQTKTCEEHFWQIKDSNSVAEKWQIWRLYDFSYWNKSVSGSPRHKRTRLQGGSVVVLGCFAWRLWLAFWSNNFIYFFTLHSWLHFQLTSQFLCHALFP